MRDGKATVTAAVREGRVGRKATAAAGRAWCGSVFDHRHFGRSHLGEGTSAVVCDRGCDGDDRCLVELEDSLGCLVGMRRWVDVGGICNFSELLPLSYHVGGARSGILTLVDIDPSMLCRKAHRQAPSTQLVLRHHPDQATPLRGHTSRATTSSLPSSNSQAKEAQHGAKIGFICRNKRACRT